MISVAKEVIKCSLQRTYLVVPDLKQCSPNPEERVLPSSHHSLKKKEQRSHIHALAYFSSKGKTKNAADVCKDFYGSLAKFTENFLDSTEERLQYI